MSKINSEIGGAFVNWKCDQCTFQNTSSAPSCEMCDSARRQSTKSEGVNDEQLVVDLVESSQESSSLLTEGDVNEDEKPPGSTLLPPPTQASEARAACIEARLRRFDSNV